MPLSKYVPQRRINWKTPTALGWNISCCQDKYSIGIYRDSSARLGDKLIVESNQVSAYIERRGHGDRKFPSGSRKSGNEMTVEFGRNADDKTGMNPLRTIGSTRPNITRTRLKPHQSINDMIAH